jgi:hypothetical protein
MMSDALFRLVGDGDRHSGGAIPLPDAFAVVVNELIDHDSADMHRLNHLVSEALEYKEERVMAAAWRSWPAFTRDILTVLEEMHLIKENSAGRWELTPEFVPQHTFYLPGTDIPFTGRSEADRERWHNNELLHMALNPVLITMRDRADGADPVAKQLILEAERVLVRELKLDQEPEVPKITRYRRNSPRKPHEEGKRIRSGMTAFFRDVFWNKYAEQGVWYDLADAARKFEELHPEQPPISHSGDLMGSMRKVGRDMSEKGVLEMKRVMGDGAWKHVYRLKTNDPLAGAYPGTIVEVKPSPDNRAIITWEGIRKDPKA